MGPQVIVANAPILPAGAGGSQTNSFTKSLPPVLAELHLSQLPPTSIPSLEPQRPIVYLDSLHIFVLKQVGRVLLIVLL